MKFLAKNQTSTEMLDEKKVLYITIDYIDDFFGEIRYLYQGYDAQCGIMHYNVLIYL